MTPLDGPSEQRQDTAPTDALHRAAQQALGSWRAPSAAQQQLSEQYQVLLSTGPHVLWRDGAPQHLTASCHVLSPDARHVLLTLHRKARRWVQLGGHLEPGDQSLAAAALREAREESGLQGLRLVTQGEPLELHRHALADTFGSCTEHWDVVFAAVSARSNLPAVSDESLDVAWWPVDSLPPDVVDDLPDRLAAVAHHVRGLGLG